eukprot:XP_016882076.1 gastric inhibitory polypeptide receptor isoform X8 [Homo sapiens]
MCLGVGDQDTFGEGTSQLGLCHHLTLPAYHSHTGIFRSSPSLFHPSLNFFTNERIHLLAVRHGRIRESPRCLPHGPDRDPVLRGCQLHVAAGGGRLPAQSPGARGRLRGGPLPLLPAPRLGCWERNEVKAIWWIIRTPILMTILINFLIFIRILGILLSKLRTRQMRCRDYRLRLARSTLTLVPLLGVHEVVFAPVTEEQARGALRFAKLGFEIFLSSFQGFLVSVLYCFINKEVQSEIRRGWHHCRLRRSLGEEQRQLPERAFRALPSGSGPGEVPTSRGLSSGTLPGPGNEASRELESYC